MIDRVTTTRSPSTSPGESVRKFIGTWGDVHGYFKITQGGT
jgi:hypothetical protein